MRPSWVRKGTRHGAGNGFFQRGSGSCVCIYQLRSSLFVPARGKVNGRSEKNVCQKQGRHPARTAHRRCVAHPCTRSMSYLVSEGFNVSSPGFDASVPILMKEDSALSEERFSNRYRETPATSYMVYTTSNCQQTCSLLWSSEPSPKKKMEKNCPSYIFLFRRCRTYIRGPRRGQGAIIELGGAFFLSPDVHPNRERVCL